LLTLDESGAVQRATHVAAFDAEANVLWYPLAHERWLAVSQSYFCDTFGRVHVVSEGDGSVREVPGFMGKGSLHVLALDEDGFLFLGDWSVHGERNSGLVACTFAGDVLWSADERNDAEHKDGV